MSVQPARYNFKIHKGSTFQFKLTYFTGGEGSTPQDLTGYTANMILRNIRTRAIILELNTETGGILLGGTTGEIEITISSDDVDILEKQAIYELAVEHGDVREILLYGTVSIVSLLV